MQPPPLSARYDSPWKAVLTHAFRAFMTFFFAELSAGIDWSRRPRFRDKELAKLLYQRGWSKARIIVLFKAINWMMVLPAAHQQRYWRAVLKLEKERSMEWITPLEQSFMDKGWEKGLKKGLQQGREKGLEEGREEGRREGAALVLERQLTRRFGPLSKVARSRLMKASMAQLEAWSEMLPDARSLKEFFAT